MTQWEKTSIKLPNLFLSFRAIPYQTRSVDLLTGKISCSDFYEDIARDFLAIGSGRKQENLGFKDLINSGLFQPKPEKPLLNW